MRTRLPLYALLPLCLALGPFEKNPGAVDDGKEAFAEGRYDEALLHFEAAKKELPDRPELDLNRGDALYKLGRLDEAKAAYEAAAAAAPAKDDRLRAQALANLGNTHLAQGDEQKAIAAYRQSLRADPKDAEVRHNLEVLLRKIKQKPPPQNAPDAGQDGGTPDGGTPDGGQSDGGQSDGGADGGQDGGEKDGGSGDGGRPDGGDGGQGDGGESGDGGQDGGDGGKGDGSGQGDGGRDGGSDGGSPSDAPSDGGAPDAGGDGGTPQDGEDGEQLDDGGMPLKPKTDAEKLLDALKQNEKNFPLWKYQRKNQKRPTNGKDW